MQLDLLGRSLGESQSKNILADKPRPGTCPSDVELINDCIALVCYQVYDQFGNFLRID